LHQNPVARKEKTVRSLNGETSISGGTKLGILKNMVGSQTIKRIGKGKKLREVTRKSVSKMH